MSTRVFVSGGGGFIAAHTIAQLLGAGYAVRASVRSKAKAQEEPWLAALGGRERLELVEADLSTTGAFDALVPGCDTVLHMASPYVLDAKDPERDLVAPAVMGTRTMLAACAKAEGVRRVVLTSSMAAITDEPESERVLTEADWNEKSTLTRNPYYLSKTLAEREAWAFVEKEKPRWDLVVVNPFLVIGPSLSRAINTSNQVFVDLLSGAYPGIMSLTWGFVDVRDVADAHVRALATPTAHGRYICANATMSMREVVELLARHGYAQHKLPKLGLDCTIGDYAARLGSYFQPKGVGQYLRTHVGRVPRFDNGKIQRELGVRFRSLETTILETVGDLVKWGHVPPPRAAG